MLQQSQALEDLQKKIDGYHIKEFLEDINELINTCENWIKI